MIKIVEKSECTGCYACASVCPQNCITMERDWEGFWYPVVDMSRCIHCGLCELTCPVLNGKKVDNTPYAYACYHKDEAIRMQSSSGGIFTLLAEHVIDRDGVVFGAEFDEEFAVRHSFIETKEQIAKFRGSKYVQSKIGDTYKQAKHFLERGRTVLFSGTLCQIAGLKSYLAKSYENLYCVDIVCHGVPSPKVWDQYVSYREECADSKAKEISFRDKSYGWNRFSTHFKFMNDDEYLQPRDRDLYMNAFLWNLCLRPSCYDCHFKTLHRQSDMTLADFWGIQSMVPEMDDDKGTSLVFINSEKGQHLIDGIKDNIIFAKVDIDEAANCNAAALKSAPLNKNRAKFMKNFERRPIDKLVKKYCAESPIIRIKKQIKSILHTVLGNRGAE